MLNADLKIRAIPSDTLDTILDLIREEAKDVRVDTWSTQEPADYIPRGSYPEKVVRK